MMSKREALRLELAGLRGENRALKAQVEERDKEIERVTWMLRQAAEDARDSDEYGTFKSNEDYIANLAQVYAAAHPPESKSVVKRKTAQGAPGYPTSPAAHQKEQS
jgi:hypothetical protein